MAELWLCWAHRQQSEKESLAIFGRVERLLSVGCSVRSSEGEKKCLWVGVAILCGINCVVGRDFAPES